MGGLLLNNLKRKRKIDNEVEWAEKSVNRLVMVVAETLLLEIDKPW